MSTIASKTERNSSFPALEGQVIRGPQGIPLYVESHGDPSAHTRILFVHGVFQTSQCWFHQVKALAELGYYVVTLDLPWHGFSGPKKTELIPTAEIFGGSLEAVCEHFGLSEGSLVLLGWSFGGLVIRNFLLRYRPRNVSGIVSIAAMHDFETFARVVLVDDPEVGEFYQALVSCAAPMSDRLAHLRTFVERLYHRRPAEDEYYRVLGYNFHSFAHAAHVTETLAEQEPGDLPQVLQEMGCPILMIHGQKDQVLPPAYTRQMAQQFSSDQVKLLEFPVCGHSPFLEDPDAFNAALLDFLTGPVSQFEIGRA
jgi:pimeloyl-ACP methyl ester carboxylesterase